MNNVNIFHSRLMGIMRIFATLAGLLWFGVQVILADTHYVATNGPGPSPYTNWATAASNIQAAISVATDPGDIVLVSNGVYDVGGVANWPGGTVLTNRVAITNAIIVRSANNDPANTIIKGAWDPATNGLAAVRCVYMTNGSALIGFTLTNGATLQVNQPTSGTNNNHHGGGAYCSSNAIISNCVIAGNSAHFCGGGVYLYRGGTVNNCTLEGNMAYLGGGAGCYSGGMVNACAFLRNRLPARGSGFWPIGGGVYCDYGGTVSNCLLAFNYSYDSGGGAGLNAAGGTLNNCIITSNSVTLNNGGGVNLNGGSVNYCTITSNSAGKLGGGLASIYSGVMIKNCVLAQNQAAFSGGGVYFKTASVPLSNCTVAGNTATISGGGLFYANEGGRVHNCIIWGNNAPASNNIWATNGASPPTIRYTCSDPNPPGEGNIGSDPLFVDTNAGNYRLSSHSPCVNAGTNQNWMTNSVDLDGQARIRYGTVDMGAYETIYEGTIYKSW